jgi:Flp pilus assembly protein TadD
MEPATRARTKPEPCTLARTLRRSATTFVAVFFLTVSIDRAATAAEACEPAVAKVVSLQGRVEIQRAGQADWIGVERLDTRLCEGDRLRAGALSRAGLLIGPQALIRVDQNTVIALRVTPDETRVEFDSGAVYSISRFPRRYRIITPFVNAGVEGTEFLVALGANRAEIAVYEGRVAAEDRVGEPGARRLLQSGQAASFARGAPPAVRALVNPADAVQWALYYPPLDSEPVRDLPECERLATAQRPGCFGARASKLLRLGRVDNAERDIEAALGLARENADALATAAIIRVVKNDKTGALDLARRAVSQDGKSVRALLALSYAQQADFKLEDALATASRAAELEPANSVAQARRAELLLSVGRIKDAEAAAAAAVRASPTDSRARTVLGFAHLARLDTAPARAELLQAAALDPSDPLPRLGLGLAAIKDGKLADGRTEIEIAAALDPQNALLRSYLGKAYSDELRDELAGTQLERAKQLDARDPTAWFYNAIRLQALNRPGEALQELHESIERNENRAVYRSSLLLDEDQAARSASRARIYSDLGFEELAVTEARNALVADPGSFAAHRFLAEAYLPLPGFEIARVSEVLQSQLLQPVNAAALPPQLQQIRSPLLMGSGPITPSFQEFNPLFARDRHSLSLSGSMGSADTWSEEVIYGYYGGRRSIQLGQSRYDTDGFRANADLRQDFLRAFYQEDIDPQSSFQLELSRAATVSGDTRLQFEPDSFSPTQRNRLYTTALRLGARHSWQPGSMIIGSVIAQRQNTRFNDAVVDPFFEAQVQETTRNRSYNGELQYQARGGGGDMVAGAGIFQSKETGETTSTLTFPPFPPETFFAPIDSTLRSRNGYIYGYLGRPWRTRLILGASLDHAENPDPTIARSDTRLSPKLGAVLPLGRATTVRLAAFRGMKRLPSDNPSIEPTQVAGFNQVFDDVNHTRFTRYGAGLDQSWSARLHAGVELTRRDLKVPIVAAFPEEDRRELLHRGYISHLLDNRTAIGAEAIWERIDRTLTIPSLSLEPTEIETRAVPLTLTYHHPSGIFSRARLTFVRQDIKSQDGFGGQDSAGETFTPFDISLGTRLPRRRGIVTLDVLNLFNEKFRYRDTTFEGFLRVPQYAPERAIFARVQLSL